MKKFLLFAAFLTGFLFAQAQNISGVLFDKQTGEALIGASVLVKGTADGTITDANGRFDFKPQTAPPFTLVISYVGYAA